MTIRYKCPKCSSVLKIKDQLAGTDGKCPKCKNRFVVPQPEPADAGGEAAAESGELATAPAAAQAEEAVAAQGAAQAKSGDDFDVESFLMDDSSPGAKASAGLAAAPAQTGPTKPPTDRLGRRQLVATPSGAAGNPAANAQDLQVGETKVSAAALAQAEGKPPFDWGGFFKQLKSNIVYVIATPILVVGLYFGMSWIMASKLPLPSLAHITGKVTVDGQPVSNVTVILSPLDPNGVSANGKPIRLRDARGVTDSNGIYRAYYVGSTEGAPLGKVRIWVQPNTTDDFRKIPYQYQQPGTDTRVVREAGNEDKFDLAIKTK